MEYYGLDLFNGSWSTYTNYYFNPYGNWTYEKDPYGHFVFDPNDGHFSWNQSNTGYYNDTAGIEQFYYIKIDNSYFCMKYGADWIEYCDPQFDYLNASDPYAHREYWYGNDEWWGHENYYYDPYGGNYSYDAYDK
jgi:hypothetical protein